MQPAGAANYLEPWDPHDPGAQRNVLEALAAAEDEGCNLVEVSPAYGDGLAEELLGRFLPDRRGRWVVVASVCPPPLGWGRLSAEYVLRSVEASLKRLRIDAVDVLQFHGDWWRRTDYRALVDDGMPALSRLRKEGKIRFTGISSEEPVHLVA